MANRKSHIHFLLTPQQWLGIAIIAVLVAGTMGLLHFFAPVPTPSTSLVTDSIKHDFSLHQAQQDSLRKAQWKKVYPRDTISIQLHPFDPNSADSITLVHLGLKPWQASNILKYRAKGGRYRRASDLRRLYGMTDSMYQCLLPYVCIDTIALYSLRKAQWEKVYPRDTISIRLHPFDPNSADSITLVHLGFNPWQASNILKYRAKGGRYRRASDLKRLYGMTDSMYQCLLPYVCIDTIALVQRNDSLHPTHSRYASHKRDTLLNLRTADTTELQLIRGIGSYRARQIVHYRQSLGGFASVDQLTEIPALSALLCDSLSRDSLLSHFFLDSVIVVPLRVNTMRPEQLHRHPYLSFSQAQSLYELRRRRLYLDSIEQLRSLEIFTDSDIQRLRPYLDFSRREK